MDEGLLGDYCDGSIFKSHPLFSADSKALQIILYYDEFEVVNPIGSRTKTHKLGTHCYSVDCQLSAILCPSVYNSCQVQF